MKLKYRSNLAAGIVAILFGAALWFLTPEFCGVERKATYGVNSQTLPYALAVLAMACGVGLIFQSLVLKKDEVKELELGKELKGLLYMLVIAVYAVGFNYSFLISTILLGVITLAFQKDRQWLHYLIVAVMVVVIYFVFTQLLHVRLPSLVLSSLLG